MATILIADDDPIILEFASEMLKGTEHAVVLAQDGLEVLRLLQTLYVDLLITDMLMPNMDGVETIVAVRKRFPKIKVLAISSGGSIGGVYLLDMAKRLGADAVLHKPLRITPFIATIDQLLFEAGQSDKGTLRQARG